MASIRIAAILATALLATTARAQEPVAVGGGGRPPVEVNLDALDRLGNDSGVVIGQPYGSRYGRPALPGESRPGQKPIVLKPPKLGAAGGGSPGVRRAALEPPPPPEPKPAPETEAPAAAAPTAPPAITPPTLGPAPGAAAVAAPPAPAAPSTQAAPPPAAPRLATPAPPSKPATAPPTTPTTQVPKPQGTAPRAPATAPRVLEPRRTETRPIAPEGIAAAVTAGLPPIATPAPADSPSSASSASPAAADSSGPGPALLAGGAFGSIGGDEPKPESAAPAPAVSTPPAPAPVPEPEPASAPPKEAAAAPQLLAGGAFGVEGSAPSAGRAPPAPAPAPAPPPARSANGPQLLAGGAFAGGPPPPMQGPGPITGSPAPRAPVAVAPAGSTVIPPAPPAAGRQVAAAPTPAPAPAAEGPMLLRIGFGPGEEVLTPAAQTQLAQLAKQLAGSGERINIKAYAAAVKDGTAARRLSLSRALAVRRFLGDQNVAVARINVTALGAPGDSGPADRVDIVSIGR